MGTATADGPRYPAVHVRLSGSDGNTMMLMGKITSALRKAKVDPAEIGEFVGEAMSGDYDAFLRTAARWVNVS